MLTNVSYYKQKYYFCFFINLKQTIMRKTLLLCALILGACAANAQFGIQAGVDFYSAKQKVSGISINSDAQAGFTAGVVYSAPIGNDFSFMPSLNFTQKGGKMSESGAEEKVTLNYIDLPLNFVYNIHGFFVGAGPALGFGISGKDKGTFGGQSETNDVNFGSGDDDDLKPFEISANILAGYKFSNGFFVSANYNPGLNDISNDDDSKYHNSGFGIRIGYMFGGMKAKSSSIQ
jgi:outer membrane protein with beta-barrel domain